MAFTREQVIAEARTWLGTLWHHQASVQRVGCDCIGFVRGAAERFVGPIPLALHYTATCHLYRAEPRIYLGFQGALRRDRAEHGSPPTSCSSRRERAGASLRSLPLKAA